jgi:hypothetical protein
VGCIGFEVLARPVNRLYDPSESLLNSKTQASKGISSRLSYAAEPVLLWKQNLKRWIRGKWFGMVTRERAKS